MRCTKCGKELPENTDMTMHVECVNEILGDFHNIFRRATTKIINKDD